MRARNIKPGFFNDEELLELPPLTRLLFAGLWCLADREGRLPDKPKRIKIEILPCDDCDVDAALQSLHECGRIERYEVDGVRYIQVANFLKHQKPHPKEVPSTIPEPTKVAPGSHLGNTQPIPRCGSAGRIPDSGYLIPDSGFSDTGLLKEDTTVSKRTNVAIAPDLPPSPPKPPSAIDRRFEEFWGFYPLKKSKGTAQKWYSKNKPDDATHKAILAGIIKAKKSRQWTENGGQFIPYPASWLNAKGWEDEPDTAERSQSSGTNHRQGYPDDAGRRTSPSGGAGDRYKPDPSEVERIARERGVL